MFPEALNIVSVYIEAETIILVEHNMPNSKDMYQLRRERSVCESIEDLERERERERERLGFRKSTRE